MVVVLEMLLATKEVNTYLSWMVRFKRTKKAAWSLKERGKAEKEKKQLAQQVSSKLKIPIPDSSQPY